MVPSFITLIASPALAASDRGACRRARRDQTVEGWTKYVLDHPEGRCADEAIGQLVVLNLGRFASAMAGDRTKVALALAQLGHTDAEDLTELSSLLGGIGGLGEIGGFGGRGFDDLLGADPYSYDYDSTYEGDNEIYVSFFADAVDGSWSEEAFYSVLDEARGALQDCYSATGRNPTSIYYTVAFELISGAVTVDTVDQTYSSDLADYADVADCVRSALDAAAFPADYTGRYTYRVELY